MSFLGSFGLSIFIFFASTYSIHFIVFNSFLSSARETEPGKGWTLQKSMTTGAIITTLASIYSIIMMEVDSSGIAIGLVIAWGIVIFNIFLNRINNL